MHPDAQFLRDLVQNDYMVDGKVLPTGVRLNWIAAQLSNDRAIAADLEQIWSAFQQAAPVSDEGLFALQRSFLVIKEVMEFLGCKGAVYYLESMRRSVESAMLARGMRL